MSVAKSVAGMVAAIALASVGEAATYTATIKGTLAYGSDELFLFGGGVLATGQAFSAVYTFDDIAPGGMIGASSPGTTGNALTATTFGVIGATFTMGSSSVTFGNAGGQILRESTPGFGRALFTVDGGPYPQGFLTFDLVSYGTPAAITGTDFRDPFALTNPPAAFAHFYTAYYDGGRNRATELALGVQSVAVEAVTSPAPEPATWTMLVAGFGIVGGAIRRRKLTLGFA